MMYLIILVEISIQNIPHWNSHNDQTIVMNDFKTSGYLEIWFPSAVYVASKQMISLIGGCNSYNQNGEMVGI